MKTTLTIEQSAELIKRGVSEEKASEIFIDAGEHGMFSTPKATSMMLECAREAKVISPIFTLADLLSLLPKKIDDTYRLKIQSCDWPAWTVCYKDFQSGAKGWHQSIELIDALYKLMIWAIDNHVKLD